MSETRILDISIWKGSTSVLADYLFAAADWTEYEETFYLKFGFLLQLVDDLQDMEEDQKAERNTLMTAARNPQFFSKRYLKALEPYLPFPLDFIKKMKKPERLNDN